MSGSSQTTQQSQNATSAPWAPTQGTLYNLISQINGYPTGNTSAQNSALGNLQTAANGLPNFSGQSTNLANGLLSGIPNLNAGLQSNQSQLQNTLSPFTNPANLNPMNTPGLSDSLNYLNNQISSNVNGQFAAAGRSLSPANSQATAYGLASAEAPLLTSQYNQNVQNLMNAGNSLFQGGLSTNSGLLGNAGAGLTAAGNTQGLALNPALAQLQAANSAYSLPLSNLGGAENLLLPIASLGGQTTSQGTSTTNYNPSTLSTLGGLFGGGSNSLASGLSGAGLGLLGLL